MAFVLVRALWWSVRKSVGSSAMCSALDRMPYRDQVTEPPDPLDRSRPWCGDQPAYLAHYLARTSTHEGATGFGSDITPLINAYSQAIPTPEALHAVATLTPLVEVGAGNGYWARLLADLGADVIATDCEYPEVNGWLSGARPWIAVEVIDAVEAVRRYRGRNLFACWPPRPNGYMTDVLAEYSGDQFALVTDGPIHSEYGEDPLYGALDQDWDCVGETDLPHWPYRFDCLRIWRRK